MSFRRPEIGWPKSNVEFWENKIRTNKERDEKNYHILRDAGWNVIVIWECQLKPTVIEETMAGIISQIGNPQKPFEYPDPDSGLAVAAEPEASYSKNSRN